MATHLVKIENLGDGVIELFQYVGKAFQLSIATDTKQYQTKQQILDLIENFRLEGEKVLA